MKRALRWIRNGLLGLLALIVILIAGVYAASELIIRRKYDVKGTPVAISSDVQSIAEGARLARIRGCSGCHGSRLEGQMFIDDPMLARIAAPSLTIAAREYSDAQLERIIRHGVRPDSRSVFVMPSEMFRALDDDDTGRIIAYIRSVPHIGGQRRRLEVGPLARAGLALGKFHSAAAEAQRAATLDTLYRSSGSSHARGAYIARTVCTECHGLDLTGGNAAPDLRIAAGYSRDQFMQFMRTGKALGNRELELMSDVARSRFSHLTNDEIDQLYAYLLARAAH